MQPGDQARPPQLLRPTRSRLQLSSPPLGLGHDVLQLGRLPATLRPGDLRGHLPMSATARALGDEDGYVARHLLQHEWDPALVGSAAALGLCGLQGHGSLVHRSGGHIDGLL